MVTANQSTQTLRAIWQKQLTCWPMLTPAQQAALIDNSRTASYAKDSFVYSASEQCLGVFCVQKGILRVYIDSPDGRQITLYRLFADDLCMLAATCVLQSISFTVHIEAIAASQLTIIPANIFAATMQQNKDLELFAYKESARRFSEIMWTVQQILFLRFDCRLAAFLLHEQRDGQPPFVACTHETMAKLLGSAREVVSRMLREFSDNHWISQSRGKVYLLDLASLQKLAANCPAFTNM